LIFVNHPQREGVPLFALGFRPDQKSKLTFDLCQASAERECPFLH
jgi:hypothetical protein